MLHSNNKKRAFFIEERRMFGLGILDRIRIKRERRNHFDKMLAHIHKEQYGLEIGPSLRPCAPKREGYHVETIDHLSRQELIEKYASMGLDTAKIEEVDYIWRGGSYSDLTGKTDSYDYILASHLIEHVPDFVGFLNDCAHMLKMDGILSLAVPDKRYSLDHFRMVTTTGKVINDYLAGETCGSMGSLTDYWNHVVNRNGLTSWGKWRDIFTGRSYRFIHDEAYNLKGYRESVGNPCFRDFHHNVFTPASFEMLIYELWEYRLIHLKIEALYRTRAGEFIVAMKKTEDPPVMSEKERMALLRRVSRENRIT